MVEAMHNGGVERSDRDKEQTAAVEPPFDSSTCPERQYRGADSAVGDEAVVPLGAGPRSSRNTSVPVED